MNQVYEYNLSLFAGALEIENVQYHDVGSYRCNASGYGQYRLSNKAQLGLLSSDIGKCLVIETINRELNTLDETSDFLWILYLVVQTKDLALRYSSLNLYNKRLSKDPT